MVVIYGRRKGLPFSLNCCCARLLNSGRHIRTAQLSLGGIVTVDLKKISFLFYHISFCSFCSFVWYMQKLDKKYMIVVLPYRFNCIVCNCNTQLQTSAIFYLYFFCYTFSAFSLILLIYPKA